MSEPNEPLDPTLTESSGTTAWYWWMFAVAGLCVLLWIAVGRTERNVANPREANPNTAAPASYREPPPGSSPEAVPKRVPQ